MSTYTYTHAWMNTHTLLIFLSLLYPFSLSSLPTSLLPFVLIFFHSSVYPLLHFLFILSTPFPLLSPFHFSLSFYFPPSFPLYIFPFFLNSFFQILLAIFLSTTLLLSIMYPFLHFLPFFIFLPSSISFLLPSFLHLCIIHFSLLPPLPLSLPSLPLPPSYSPLFCFHILPSLHPSFSFLPYFPFPYILPSYPLSYYFITSISSSSSSIHSTTTPFISSILYSLPSLLTLQPRSHLHHPSPPPPPPTPFSLGQGKPGAQYTMTEDSGKFQ